MSHATHHTDGPVSVVTMNRPERLNAISGPMLNDLQAALVEAQAEASTRVIVFTGAGRSFCAGDDLKEFEQQAQSAQSIAAFAQTLQEITRLLMFGDKLVVGAARGYAAGGGFEWLLNCDLVVAGEDLQAFFPEMSLGHFVTGGVTHLLPQALGHQKAMELFVLGERQSAQDLLRYGLVNRVVPTEQVLDEAMAMAQAVAQRSFESVKRLKRVLTSGGGQGLAGALDTESVACRDFFANADTAERIRQRTQNM
jgi:enoyl-CoA hydratase/carnithine racemase